MNEDAKAAKTRRLAEALRANLRRRKGAGRGDGVGRSPGEDEVGTTARPAPGAQDKG